MVDFYHATLCKARNMPSSCVCTSVCLSVCVCVSVTLQYCMKTAKGSITQIIICVILYVLGWFGGYGSPKVIGNIVI